MVIAAKLHELGVRTVGEVAGLGEQALCRSSAEPPGAIRTPWRTISTRAPVDTGRRRRSIGSQQALGRRPVSPRTWTRSSPAPSTG
ncbi:MAG: hypothetical protein ACRDRH_02295 [Pseudonocardia sp.]